MLETGTSRSELLGLRWSIIDTGNRCIHIQQGLVADLSADIGTYVMASDGLKNKICERTIPVDDALWNRLCQAHRTVTLGKKVVLTEQVIHSTDGNVYQPSNWSNVRREGLKRCRHMAISPELY